MKRKENAMKQVPDEKKQVKVLTKAQIDLQRLVKMPDVGLSVAGQSVTRTDAASKVSGKLKFGADYAEEGVLHGKILRSPHPHALIRSIRTERAKALTGVAAVLTAADVPGRNGFGAVIPDQPVICGDKVRFVGDGVALVAAETEELAEEALSLIEVIYEPLPAVFDPKGGHEAGCPKDPRKRQPSLLQQAPKRRGGERFCRGRRDPGKDLSGPVSGARLP